MLREPNEHQLEAVANTIQEELLRNWDTSLIRTGILRVQANEIGDITHVYVSHGLFATLCHRHFGDRTRRAFNLGGYRVKSWRPNINGIRKS